jgi:hypothetical protein
VLTTLMIDPDAPQDWAWDGTRYTAPGGGVIEPYAHPMTEHAAVTDGARTAVILRERTRYHPGLRPGPVRVAPRELDRVTALAREWPGLRPCTWRTPAASCTARGAWADCTSSRLASTPRRPPGCSPTTPLQLRNRLHRHLAAH